MSGVGGPPVILDTRGRPYRHFPAAVSAGAMALQWARQGAAPHGATVVVDAEINALGRLGQEWAAPASSSLVCAVVLRPALDVEDADVPWLIGGVGAVRGIEDVTNRSVGTWWPDRVVERDSGRTVASVMCDVQLGPGRVRAAVVTIRVDLAALGVDHDRRLELTESVLDALLDVCDAAGEDPAAPAAAYETRCVLVGRRVKIRLRPHGETRGEISGVDVHGRLLLRSATGMVERITVDMLRDLEVV